jgi:hypothetical protein
MRKHTGAGRELAPDANGNKANRKAAAVMRVTGRGVAAGVTFLAAGDRPSDQDLSPGTRRRWKGIAVTARKSAA